LFVEVLAEALRRRDFFEALSVLSFSQIPIAIGSRDFFEALSLLSEYCLLRFSQRR
jgi:hypothetical protein